MSLRGSSRDDHVVDQLVYAATCHSGKATAAAFFYGSAAWSHCVRLRDHDGDCVMGLNGMEEALLAGESADTGMMKYTTEREILAKKRRAEAAQLT